MHLVCIPNSGYLVCCNAATEEECIVCGRPPVGPLLRTTLYVQDREERLVCPLFTSVHNLPRED